MTDGWHSPSIAQTTEILHKINAAEPVTRYGSDCALALMPLPFYGDGAQLARVLKPQPTAPAQYYVVLHADTIPLDGSIANIHAANAAAPLALDVDNIEDYLSFRLYFGAAAVMLRARCEKYGGGWQATLRMRDKTGTYETTVTLSTRGELSESHKEKRSDESLALLPPFAEPSA
ncbi:MAG: hypothetical protein Q8K65_04475 [Alphaproteobacteria bacterium]|nr:hypothetical protein [Alphaproteobacteria bacterium]